MAELKKDKKPKKTRSKRLLPDKVFDQPARILERVEVDFTKLDIIAVNHKNALLEFFITFGGPKIIVIDNGDCFQSESFDRASTDLRIN
jgi:hypothetical protein